MSGRTEDSLQSISVRLDGKNYSYWGYVMKKILRGKSMWGYISGVRVQPTDINADDYAKSLDIWETDNAKIITLINNSVSHSIGAQLAKYETAKEVWDHLARLYTQSNFAKQYQLEADIRVLRQQDMGIQDFYSAMSELWDQLALIESSELRAFPAYVTRREEQRLVQFLMALRDDFEGLRGTILHHSPLPSVDLVVHEFLAEEIHLKSQVDKKTIASSTPSVFTTPQRSMPHNQNRSKNDHCNNNISSKDLNNHHCNIRMLRGNLVINHSLKFDGMPGIHMQMLHRVAIGGGGGRRGCAAVPPPPRGWMAVRVGSQGEEQQRFVVPVGYLNHPLFLALLRAAEEEYGFHHSGAITLPCHVEHFRQVQGIIDRDTSTSADHRHHHHHFHLCFRA
ncbi:hypothetical protein ZIOFF_064603 [Zingiber officinale]|uniref:Retrotransposon Copia-like N-terminal domain-containing protein n=2 Tax=Zingiber officinale TaxID=94328 RepID=A0A8J5EW51_ZINOF|nr:hypothetical protein ZIOFF_064603 [Zingiber officinale]